MIRGKQLSLPILQGGMGVGISLDRLAGAVAACGGMGTISTAFCGFQEPDFEQNPKAANLRALERQVKHAKELAKGAGLVAINAMVATSQYAESVRTALRAGVDAVVCGAGLPKDLPAIAAEVPESDAALASVVSGGRAAGLICKLWDRHYHRIPDFVVLEGPQAGGHLGFSKEDALEAQAGHPKPLSDLLHEVLEALAPFKEKYQRDIPVFVAGGVKDGREMHRYMEEGTQPRPDRCVKCLVPCDFKTTPYCISKALIAARNGDWENGLFFCDANAGEVNSLSTVREQMDQIMNEWRTAT